MFASGATTLVGDTRPEIEQRFNAVVTIKDEKERIKQLQQLALDVDALELNIPLLHHSFLYGMGPRVASIPQFKGYAALIALSQAKAAR